MKKILLVLLILVATGTLRFAKLDAWPFDHDELATILEANILFGQTAVPEVYLKDGTVKPEDTQIVRLPKMLLLAHTTHYLGYRLLGEDEFNSRVLPAVFGTLSVGAVFLLAVPLFGMPGAAALALLVMLWPTHLFQSQQNRFYIETFFFEVLVFLLAATVAKYRRTSHAILLGLAAGGMILCHALTGLIWGIVLAGIAAAGIAERRQPPSGVLAGLAGFSLLFLGFAVFYLVPLAKGWNELSSSWGYSPLHSVLATVNMLGFPIALFAVLGGLLVLTNLRNPDNAFWTTVAAGCLGCIGMLPKLIVFNPMYLFLFTFPFFVLTAQFADRVFQRLREPSMILAVAWLGAVCCSNLPSLASHYLDGSRYNHREAFEYVREHWQSGDRLTGFTMGIAEHYVPECEPRIPLRMVGTVEQLEEIVPLDGGRLWIVVRSNRGGLDLELRRWLGEHCTYELRVGKRRFDYAEYTVEVFLYKM